MSVHAEVTGLVISPRMLSLLSCVLSCFVEDVT